jgi:sulfate permease, SulP family
VGLFCLASGLSLASGQPLTGISTWVNLLRGPVVLRLAPAIVMAATLSMVQKRVRTPLALPLLLLVAPLFFYAVLFVGGWSLEDARAGGWVTEPQQGAGPHWRPWHVWKLYNITSFPPQNIYWAALPRQIGKLFGLYVAVAFGSSMDVAAIQTEAPKDLEFNRELVTVGVSNIVAGCFGVGLTGSYIFSQVSFVV